MHLSSSKPLHIDSALVKHKKSFSSNGGFATYTKHYHIEKLIELTHYDDTKKLV